MLRNPAPQTRLQIENPKGLPLPAATRAILQQMFAACQRVVIKAELGGGFSASRVFVVQPVGAVPELPVVIKLAPGDWVDREYQAYHDYIRNRLSGAAEIHSQPVRVPGSDWGGLRYHLVGSGIFEIESLYAFCRRASPQDIGHVLEKRLFRRIGPLWRFGSSGPQFSLGASYDRLLPVNLLIEPTTPPSGADVHLLEPDVLAGLALKQGDYVRLEGLVVSEVEWAHEGVTLNLPTPNHSAPDSLPKSYRLRLQPVEVLSSYEVNQPIDPIEGVVRATRHDLLRAQVRRALGQEWVDAPELSLAQTSLPNPLTVLADILGTCRDVRVACIHGDLNLENVLVDPEARDVRLIDFTLARRDHVLHDPLRLETGIVTWLVPEALAKADLPPETIHALYEHLHRSATSSVHLTEPSQFHPALGKALTMLAAVRRAAGEFLFDPQDWTEYYQGLVLCLLGALKFQNLDDMPQAPLPKQVAFWGAASAVHRLQARESLRGGKTWQSSSAIQADSGVSIDRPTFPPIDFIPNPFTATLAVQEPGHFVGRQSEIRRLRALLRGGSVALMGEPKIGKSSLLWHLVHIWTQVEEGEVLGPFDCHVLEDRDDLYESLAAVLGLDAGLWRTVRRALRRPSERPTLLLLDEMDVAPERGLVHDDLARLRAVCSDNRSLKIVTASRMSLKMVFPDPGKGSPAYNFLQPLTLGALTEAEARLLLAHPWAPQAAHFDLDTCDQILALTDFHPFKLQRAAFHRYQALADPSYDWQAAYRADLEQML